MAGFSAEREGSPLKYHCGRCAAPLVDASTLLTSCGHFFCAKPSSLRNTPCTQLVPGKNGKCEQCKILCTAALLTNKADCLDENVRSFAFGDVGNTLEEAAKILQVRLDTRLI